MTDGEEAVKEFEEEELRRQEQLYMRDIDESEVEPDEQAVDTNDTNDAGDADNAYEKPVPKVGKKRKKGTFAAIYRIIMLGLGMATFIVAVCIFLKVSALSREQDVQAVKEIDSSLAANDDNFSGGVMDTGEINDGDLSLTDIQEMDSNDIIDTYLISKTDAKRNDYDADNFVQDDTFWYYEEDGEKISKAGIDVSSYQGDIDWKKVKAAGVDFAIIRVGIRGYGSGKLVEDEKFEENIKGAAAAGLDVGVYFFSQAINTDEALEEAEFVYGLIKDYDLTMPVVYDTEKISDSSARTNKAKLTSDDRTDMAIAFCDYFNDKGYDTMIYSNKRWFLRSLNLERLDEYSIWLAQYSTDLEYPFHFGIWQYSAEGKVDGIEGYVDLDIYIPGKD